MRLVVVGVNHKTAPVAMREKLAFGDDLPQALQSLNGISSGASIVSTCNRSEIYAYVPCDTDFVEDVADQHEINEQGEWIAHKTNAISSWLADFKHIPLATLLPYLYVYEGNRALTHWLRVAVGLDSMILGEPQILGQVKKAVALSHEYAMTPAFDSLTQRLFAAARIVRRDTALGKQAVTLGFATAKLVTQIFDAPQKTTLLIVAAGEMNRLVAHNVAALGMHNIIICNRSLARAEKLSEELHTMANNANRTVQIELVDMAQLETVLYRADVISSCSGSMHALIDKKMVKSALKKRKNRAMLMVDLAVPRDIEPDVGDLDGVYLYSVDDLQYVIQGNIQERKQAAIEAELLVGQLASEIEQDMQMQAMGKVIVEYRQVAYDHMHRLLQQAKNDIHAQKDPIQTLERLAHRLTNTLLHPPSKMLGASAAHFDEQILAQINELILHAYRR